MALSLFTIPTLKKYRNALVHLVFPRTCLLCDTELQPQERCMCRKCIHKLPYTKYENLENNPVDQLFWGKVRVEKAMALLFFRKGERPQKILHHIKYRHATDLGIGMGELIGKRLMGANFINPIDVVIPIPLHPRRLKHRGYNQSELIAQGICRVSGLPLLPKAIERSINTETQTHKNRFERHLNVHRIFAVPNPKQLEGKHILLIDDVVTTGATLEACINQLGLIPGTRVSVAALAWATDC